MAIISIQNEILNDPKTMDRLKGMCDSMNLIETLPDHKKYRVQRFNLTKQDKPVIVSFLMGMKVKSTM